MNRSDLRDRCDGVILPADGETVSIEPHTITGVGLSACLGGFMVDLLPENGNTLISTAEAAQICSRTADAIRQWVARGHLKAWEPNQEDVAAGRVILPGNYDPKIHRFRLIDVMRTERDCRRRALTGGRVA